MCPNVAGMGISEPLWLAWGFLGVSLVGLVAVWIPFLRDRRRQQSAQPERALLANIGRLPDPYGNYQLDLDSTDSVVELRRAIEVVEIAFATDSTATRAMTAEWMRLLLEANRMHNDGTLPTQDFKTLNTRLLEAVTAPAADNSSV